MKKPFRFSSLMLLVAVVFFTGCQTGNQNQWTQLFPEDGAPGGWTARHWADVSEPPAEPVTWEVREGMLFGGLPRGSWLMSERQYGNFILEFDFKLGPRGNSGVALRVPMDGDPAFDGIELQMADFRYNTEAKDSELTGGIYRAVAPSEQVYRPEQWNHYRIELKGPKLRAWLNGVAVQDIDLSEHDVTVLRHDGSEAVPLNQRPLKGHIGFQELSRDDSRVLIRNARIRELPPGD